MKKTPWNDSTLITMQQAPNGYWRLLELPANHSTVETFHRSFRTEELANQYAATQYTDAEWVAQDEMAKESNDRYTVYKQNMSYTQELYYPDNELWQAQQAVAWIADMITCIGEVQGPIEDTFQTDESAQDFYCVRFLTKGELLDEEQRMILTNTQPSQCSFNAEDE